MKLKFKHLFARNILERGYDYFEGKEVSDVRQKDEVYYAVVRGSENYQVEITIENRQVKEMKCSCPYAKNHSCKHEAALLLYLCKDEAPQTYVAKEEEETEPFSIQTLSTIPHEQLVLFLHEYSQDHNQFKLDISSHFSQYLSMNASSYSQEWTQILSDSMGRKDYIDYYESSNFEHKTCVLLGSLKEFVKTQPLTVFRLCKEIYYGLVDLAIDDLNVSTLTLASEVLEVVAAVLNNENHDVNEEIRSWISETLNDPELSDYCLDEGLENLYLQSIPLKKQIEYLEQELEIEEEYKKDNIILKLIRVFEKANYSDDKIKEALSAHDHFNSAVTWLVENDLKYGFVKEAIERLKKAMVVISLYSDSYQKWLVNVYKEYGYEMEFETEARAYIGGNAYEIVSVYKDLRERMVQEDWLKIRDKVLHTIKDSDKLAQCLVIESMGKELMQLIIKRNLSFNETYGYEPLLLQEYSSVLIERYFEECDCNCDRASQNKYCHIRNILVHIKKMPGGKEQVERKIQELKIKFKRRTSFVAVLDEI